MYIILQGPKVISELISRSCHCQRRSVTITNKRYTALWEESTLFEKTANRSVGRTVHQLRAQLNPESGRRNNLNLPRCLPTPLALAVPLSFSRALSHSLVHSRRISRKRATIGARQSADHSTWYVRWQRPDDGVRESSPTGPELFQSPLAMESSSRLAEPATAATSRSPLRAHPPYDCGSFSRWIARETDDHLGRHTAEGLAGRKRRVISHRPAAVRLFATGTQRDARGYRRWQFTSCHSAADCLARVAAAICCARHKAELAVRNGRRSSTGGSGSTLGPSNKINSLTYHAPSGT